ncbi:MAG: hypothetical protein R6V04_07865 [bacterium]
MNNKFTQILFSILLVILIATPILIISPKWLVDDAYIIFRYAENLTEHGQLTFNVGEDPVEGYTGILMTLIMSLFSVMSIQLEQAAHLTGAIAFIFMLFFFYKLVEKLSDLIFVRLISLFLFSTASFLYLHIYSGLETMLFTALLLGAALLVYDLLDEKDSISLKRYVGMAFLLLILSLCRPEGALYALIVIILFAVNSILNVKSLRPLFAIIVLFVLPGIIYFIWRWNYYGHFLPNTFYVKLSGSVSKNTIESLMIFTRQYVLIPFACVIVGYISSLDETADLIRIKRTNYASPSKLIILSSLIVWAVIVALHYRNSFLMMNYSYRFYVPFYPIVILIFATFLTPVIKVIMLKKNQRKLTYYFLISWIFLLLLIQTFLSIRRFVFIHIPFAVTYRELLDKTHRPAGNYLRERVPINEWLVVHIDAGMIPYYSDLKTIDFGGLNDEYLAQHNDQSFLADRINYFFKRSPGACVFTSYKWGHVYHNDQATAIISDQRFGNYALVKKFGDKSINVKNILKSRYYNNMNIEGYFQFIFLRKDLLRENEEIEYRRNFGNEYN